MSENTSFKFDRSLEMMKYYQDEFMYRHKLFWDLLIKFFVLFIVVSTLPIMSGVLGAKLSEIPQRYLIIFPIVGILISLFSRYILLEESRRLTSVNDTKKSINQKCFIPKYQYIECAKKGNKTTNKKLSSRLPNIMFFLELVIAGCVILIIYF